MIDLYRERNGVSGLKSCLKSDPRAAAAGPPRAATTGPASSLDSQHVIFKKPGTMLVKETLGRNNLEWVPEVGW